MKRRLPLYEHPVRVRHTIAKGGKVTTCRTTYCTLAQDTRRPEECAVCESYRGMTFNPSSRRARIRCEAPRVEDRILFIAADRVVCVREDVSTFTLWSCLVRLRTRRAIVVSPRDEPVGVLVCDRDPRSPRPVREPMRPVTLRVPEDASIIMAANLIPHSPVDPTPVVASDGSVVGTVSERRILEWIEERTRGSVGAPPTS